MATLGGVLLSVVLFTWSSYVRSLPLVLVVLPAIVGVVFGGVLLFPLQYVGRDHRWTIWPPRSR